MEKPVEFMSPELRHVVVSVNPKAGAWSADARVARLVDLLRRQQLEVAVLSNLDETAGQSDRLFREGRLRTLISVGGDGTVAELVNRTAPGLPMTVFPAGNENLLARYFGLGPTPEECCRTVVEGAVVRRDAGQANRRIFLIMVSCGFDADVVHCLHLHRTGHVTSASYFNPIMASIRHYDYPELRVYWNEDGVAETGVTPRRNRPSRQRPSPTACVGFLPSTFPATGPDCRLRRKPTGRTGYWTFAPSAKAACGTGCTTRQRS